MTNRELAIFLYGVEHGITGIHLTREKKGVKPALRLVYDFFNRKNGAYETNLAACIQIKKDLKIFERNIGIVEKNLFALEGIFKEIEERDNEQKPSNS
jgi:hypothetical protein